MTINEDARPRGETPDALLKGIREFLGGHRTLAGYGVFADWVRELDSRLRAGDALPADWAAPRARLLFIAGELTRLHGEWHARAAGLGSDVSPGEAAVLRDCAGHLEAAVTAAGQAPGGEPDITDPYELVDMALLLLGRAREVLS